MSISDCSDSGDHTISEDGLRISGLQSPLTGVSRTLTLSMPTTNDKRQTTNGSPYRASQVRLPELNNSATRHYSSSTVYQSHWWENPLLSASAGHNSVTAVDPPSGGDQLSVGSRVVRSASSRLLHRYHGVGSAVRDPWSKSEPGITTDGSHD